MLPVTIENQLSIGDYTSILLKKTYKRPAFILLSAIGVCTLIVQVLYQFGAMNKVFVDFLPWPFALFPVVLPLLAVYKARALYNASKRMKSGVRYTFSEDTLHAVAVDSEWTYNWDAIIKFEESGDLLLLYPTPSTAEIIKKELLTREQIEFIKIKTSKFSI